jgi:hypothetical protein
MNTVTLTQNEILLSIFVGGFLTAILLGLICSDNPQSKKQEENEEKGKDKENEQCSQCYYNNQEKIVFSRNYDETSDIVGFDINQYDWYNVVDNQDMLDDSFDIWLKNTILPHDTTMEEALLNLSNKELSLYCEKTHQTARKREMVDHIMARMKDIKSANIQKKLQRLRRMLE